MTEPVYRRASADQSGQRAAHRQQRPRRTGALLADRAALERIGQALGSRRVIELLTITTLITEFDTYETEQQAIDSFLAAA